MPLEVFFREDIKSVIDGVWRAYCAGLPVVQTEREKAMTNAVESILHAVALSCGIQWRANR